MGSHPINLAVRFLLELAALVAMALWGWHQGQGVLRLVATLGAPVTAAVVWSTFAVSGDPSRSGSAPVPVPGVLRLCLEAAFFAFAAWSLYATGSKATSAIFGAIVVAHYAVSYDRMSWLVRAA
jgi:hypothetical protein